MRLLTSMKRARFEELYQGILDGSLADRLQALVGREDELTKSERVLLRQLSAIINVAQQSPKTMARLAGEQWRELFLRGEPGGPVRVEVKR